MALLKKETQMRDAVIGRDIVSLLWIFLEECVEDIREGKEPRYGLDMFKSTLSHVAQLQAKGVQKPLTDTGRALEKFLKIDAKSKKKLAKKEAELIQDEEEDEEEDGS